jgi:SAM-dependent methyltransferase
MRRVLLTEFIMQAPYQPATNYWRAVEIEEVIQYGLPKGQGLDLGCGDGHLMAIMLEHIGPRDLVGIDIDPQESALARARKIYREVATAPADHIPFADSRFDFVFSNSVLEHIENIEGVLTEVARVLRPGGQFLFTVPGPEFHRCLKGPRFGNQEAYFRETDARCAHLRYWDAARWSEYLQRAGLIPVHQREYLTRGQVRRWEWIARNTSGIVYGLVRRKKQPIEIQRAMKIRSARVRLPRFAAALCAGIMDFGVGCPGPPHGCLLVEAKRTT